MWDLAAARHPGARGGWGVHRPRRRAGAARRQRRGDQRPAARSGAGPSDRGLAARADDFVTAYCRVILLRSKIGYQRHLPLTRSTHEAADMTDTAPATNGSKGRARADRPIQCDRVEHAQADRDRQPRWRWSRRSSARSSWTLQPARPAQPRPALRRQDGVLGRRGRQPRSSSGSRAWARPPTRLKASGKRLLRPDPRRRPADDRRDRQGVRRRDSAPGRPRRRRRRRPTRPTCSPRPPSWASPRSTSPRTSTASPHTARRSPTCWSPRHWPTATWVWRCRSWPPAGVAVGADPLGQRRPAGHLPAGVRRRERPAGLRGDRRAAAAVRPDRR